MAVVTACGGAAIPAAAPSASMLASPALSECFVPGGHAYASAITRGGSASLQMDFLQPCDLAKRVSAIDVTLRLERPGEVIHVAIKADDMQLASPVTVYDVTRDGPAPTMLFRRLSSIQPTGSLDQLHTIVCAGHATLEVVVSNGPKSIEARITPSSTDKC